jgi:hypothetical protein
VARDEGGSYARKRFLSFTRGRSQSRYPISAAYVRRVEEAELIRGLLETGQPPPLADGPAEVRVFVSGHTHAPALTQFRGPAGQEGAIVNSGCWLRQLQPLPARLGPPRPKRREPFWFARPETATSVELPHLQDFLSRRLGHGIGPQGGVKRPIGQHKMPVCRHFEGRERRDSNPRPPACQAESGATTPDNERL